ncbi:uncharacterized protein M421DRAFT_29311, partial [Didymella exigua CBS 183.55]
LKITDTSINNLVANISIPAPSLNTWYGNHNVSKSTFQSVFRFSDPHNLLVPYTLCLGLTLVIVLLGLNGLRRNGTSATEGCFLQVIMTTSGETTMHRAVKQRSVGGIRNAPKELLDLKVKFGEFVNEGETTLVERRGFRTLEEVISFQRKR